MAVKQKHVNVLNANKKPKFSVVDLIIYLMCEMEIEKDAKKKYKLNEDNG